MDKTSGHNEFIIKNASLLKYFLDHVENLYYKNMGYKKNKKTSCSLKFRDIKMHSWANDFSPPESEETSVLVRFPSSDLNTKFSSCTNTPMFYPWLRIRIQKILISWIRLRHFITGQVSKLITNKLLLFY